MPIKGHNVNGDRLDLSANSAATIDQDYERLTLEPDIDAIEIKGDSSVIYINTSNVSDTINMITNKSGDVNLAERSNDTGCITNNNIETTNNNFDIEKTTNDILLNSEKASDVKSVGLKSLIVIKGHVTFTNIKIFNQPLDIQFASHAEASFINSDHVFKIINESNSEVTLKIANVIHLDCDNVEISGSSSKSITESTDHT